MNSLILNSMSFLDWQADSVAFWVLLVLAAILYFISMSLYEESPLTAVFVNLLCAGTLFLYSGTTGEVFWFINFEEQNLIVWFVCYLLTAVFFGILIGMTWGHIKLVVEIFSDFWVGLVGLVIGCICGILLLRFFSIIISEHPIICVLTLLGAIGSGSPSHTPTIYVKGEGHITGHGYDGGSSFRGDNGNHYTYDGSKWYKS